VSPGPRGDEPSDLHLGLHAAWGACLIRYTGQMSSHSSVGSLPDYVLNNRAQWDAHADDRVEAGEPVWG
jgi:hypothetical protein